MVKCHHLYDFPLEIIKTLLDNVVDTIGIADTTRLRLVCKLFDREVPGALYRLQDFRPPGSVRTPSHERVVREYILYRALADGKRKRNLSARLHRILEAILPDERSDQESRQTSLETLVAAVARQSYCCDGFLPLVNPATSNTLLDSTFRSDCLKAAATLGINQMFDGIIADACHVDQETNINDLATAFEASSLVFAAMGGHLSLVIRILDAREAASRDTELEEIGLALRAATLGGHKDIVRLLLDPKYGYLEDYKWLSSLAASINRVDIFYMICERLQLPLDDLRSLTEAARFGHTDFVKLCLIHGANVNGNAIPMAEMYEQESPLQAASSRGYRKIVQLLLAHGANPTDYLGSQQSLTGAARAGHHEIVADLLAAGAVPAHHQRWSPLVAACQNGQFRVVEVLLDSGVQLWYYDRALSVASGGGYESLVRLLASRGASVDGITRQPFDSFDPPILLAKFHGHNNVVRALKELGAKDVVLPVDS